VGTLKNYGEVWFSENAIANIILLSRVKERYPVKYDITAGNQFVIIQPDKEVIFNQSSSGLYYHDTANQAIVMVNTVAENREGFTQREYDDAKVARRGLVMVGYPSPKDFKNMAKLSGLPQSPF
jgi:hypothetical protein